MRDWGDDYYMDDDFYMQDDWTDKIPRSTLEEHEEVAPYVPQTEEEKEREWHEAYEYNKKWEEGGFGMEW